MVILAAIDGDDLSGSVVSVGNDLAVAHDESLVVLYVMSNEEAEERTDTRPEYYLDDAIADAEAFAESLVKDALGDGGDVEVVGRVGDPVETLLAEANELDPRYLVIGGRKRTPAGKALFGDVTQSILLSAERPVVTVMQDGSNSS
ncbi:MAG: universal stress protein [Halobacteriota archaeon]